MPTKTSTKKRGPGRPRKVTTPVTKTVTKTVKRGPGRPRKEEALARVAQVESARTPVKAPTKAPTRVRKAPTNLPKAGSKAEVIYKLLTRPKGCTRSEVLESTGWPSISMQHTAKLMGLDLRMDKSEGEPKRYYGSP